MPSLTSPAEADIHRVFAAERRTWPLHGAAASRAVEQQAAAALPAHTLMQRAGLACARLAQAVAPHAGRVLVVAGGGNNGGDALEAAFHLRNRGRDVLAFLAGDAHRLPADAAASLARAREAGVAVHEGLPSEAAGPWDLAIDGLLGLGMREAPRGALAEGVAWLNAQRSPVLSIDLPSGLDADTGWLDEPLSHIRCVRARHTLSLLTLKPSLFTAHGRDQAGEVWFCDLGVAGGDLAPDALLAGPDAQQGLQPRRHAQHKGSFGNVHVVGGAPGMRGAALLAARSALHAGAGRVFLHLLQPDAAGDPAPGIDLQLPELMFRRGFEGRGPAPGDVVACGCGGGDAVREVLPLLLGRARCLVVDADALNAIGADAQLQALLAARAARGWATVLTPHPLEAARLLACSVEAVQADRLQQARALARRSRAVVLLKGSGSVVATPDDGEPACINPTGNALLGTAGTGDVLAGWIAALCAQGLDGRSAALRAAWLHGERAEQWLAARTGQPLTAGDLLRMG